MRKKIIFLVFSFLSIPVFAADLPRKAADAEIRCMLPYYGSERFHYYQGQKISLDLWFEQHPEQAEKYYRENAEIRKRTTKNIEAGLCP